MRVHSPSAHTQPVAGTPVLVSDETWPDTALARTIYNHFADFEGLAPDEAADSTGALLYSLQQIGVVGSMPEPGNGVRVADTATPPVPCPSCGGTTDDECNDRRACREVLDAIADETCRRMVAYPVDDDAEDALRATDWFHDSDMGAR